MVKADGDDYRKRLLKGFKGNPKRFYGEDYNQLRIMSLA